MKFLYEKDDIIYAKCTNCDRILKFKRFDVGEVKTGVECFCGNISSNIEGLPEENKITIMKINGMRLNLLRLLQLFKLKHIVLFKHQWGQYVQLVDRRMYQKYH